MSALIDDRGRCSKCYGQIVRGACRCRLFYELEQLIIRTGIPANHRLNYNATREGPGNPVWQSERTKSGQISGFELIGQSGNVS